MRINRAAIPGAVILPILLLTACNPGTRDATPPVLPTAIGSSSSPSPSSAAPDLPADALLGLTSTVTADTGAKLTLSLIVHSSKAASDPEAAPRVKALTEKCSGEVDAALLNNGAYGLVQVDYSAVLVGSTAWPVDLPLLVLPTAKDIALASTGDVTQIEVLPAPFEAGNYVPHCSQFAFLTGPGTGATYLALDGDSTNASSFTRWAHFPFGFTINSPAGFVGTVSFGGIAPQRVSFTDCAATLTPLASTLGYPPDSWSQEFATDHCAVGGNAQPMGGK